MQQKIQRDELLAALRSAAGREMTKQQVQLQKISFVMSGMTDGADVTREEVQKVIDQQEGAAA